MRHTSYVIRYFLMFGCLCALLLAVWAGVSAGDWRGVTAQDVSAVVVAKTATVRQTFAILPKRLVAITKGYPMFWVFLELALGLALFVFLVWWTLPKKDKRDASDK